MTPRGGTALKFVLRAALLTGAVLGCMLWTSGGLESKAYASANAVTLTINQQPLYFESTLPILESGKTMYVPIRSFAAQMNLDLQWSSQSNGQTQIVLSNDETSISFLTGDKQAKVNNELVMMSDSPWSYKNSTYVPMRFLIDALSLDYTYNSGLTSKLPHVNRYAYDNPAPSSGYSTVLADKVIHTAKSYIGVPYVWGGSSPSGFDCSGYINYVFKQHGYGLARTAHDMYKTLGNLKSPQKGDIVFFSENGGRITHAGISLGNNQYIHASSGKERKVIISSLGSSWAKSTYVGAKSVLK